MQFIDLISQQQRIREEIENNIRAVLDHGNYIGGPEIGELEQRLSEYVGVKHALACSSGTDALLMNLMACGVGAGDAVLTTPFTFVATAGTIALLGATPVFVDIQPDTYNIDPDNLEQTILALKKGGPAGPPLPRNHPPAALTPKAIVAVDLFGQPADYGRINAIAKSHGLKVIEDAAQSFGATNGEKRACGLSQIACTSFFPAKPLGGYGDAGMCFTDDDRLYDLLWSLKIHGRGEDKYDNVRIGINGRMASFQAAVLLAKFAIFPDELELRQEVAARYDALLAATGDLAKPHIEKGCISAWAQYSVLARDSDHREKLQKKLAHNDIPSAIYYPKPLHLQKAFAYLRYERGEFPVSEDCADRIFSLPMHPYLDEKTQARIIKTLNGNR